MTDTPTDTDVGAVVTPFAVPTRPTQDAILDPVWGQWVHDAVAGKLITLGRVTKSYTFAANGRTNVLASDVGLATIDGAVTAIQSPNAMCLTTVISGLGTATVNIAGVYWQYTTAWASVPLNITGAQTMMVLAWGTPA